MSLYKNSEKSEVLLWDMNVACFIVSLFLAHRAFSLIVMLRMEMWVRWQICLTGE